ncbi:hypothetical protein F8M49_28440 [Rhodococcus zopfii]|uniref:Uncharacterized protein n=1 Tax=Rhodococcus zopfii TaxID=43772 RepID=A0ABU3WWI3_9NOCA|nr:hypothetical protein [Rhodococcus zopfii]
MGDETARCVHDLGFGQRGRVVGVQGPAGADDRAVGRERVRRRHTQLREDGADRATHPVPQRGGGRCADHDVREHTHRPDRGDTAMIEQPRTERLGDLRGIG